MFAVVDKKRTASPTAVLCIIYPPHTRRYRKNYDFDRPAILKDEGYIRLRQDTAMQ